MDSDEWAWFIESFDSLDIANKMLLLFQKTVHFQVSMSKELNECNYMKPYSNSLLLGKTYQISYTIILTLYKLSSLKLQILCKP